MADQQGLVFRTFSPILGKRIENWEILERICVRPPYFNLDNLRFDGEFFSASTCAEAPAFHERGPMTAAELGRHAAIAGSCRAALAQADNKRRYYLARRASCVYFAAATTYGEKITFEARLLGLDKRYAQTHIDAFAGAQLVASFNVSFAVLPENVFTRLFSARHIPGLDAPLVSPYGSLLHRSFQRGACWAEQRFIVPAEACAGHFEEHPALPVAILMGQLSYLAGQLVAPYKQPYRVLEGQIEAEDLCWAGEEIVLRAERVSERGQEQTYLCSAKVGTREVGRMTLRIEKETVLASHIN